MTRRLLRCALAGGLLAALSSSCGPPLTEVWQLTDFRVLGIRMSDPTPYAGEEVSYQLITADTQATRPVTALWVLCPSLELSGIASSADAGAPPMGASFNLPRDCQFSIGTRVSLITPTPNGVNGSNMPAVSLFGVACNGMLNFTGSSFPTCSGDGARQWQFLRTITLRAPTAPANHNPRVTEVRFGPSNGTVTALDNNAPPTVPRCTDTSRNSMCPRYQFQVAFTDDSRESYTGMDPLTLQPAMMVERLTVGFVVEAGTLDGGFRTDSSADPMSNFSNGWRAPAEPGTYRVIVYASDGRGGFDFLGRSVIVN